MEGVPSSRLEVTRGRRFSRSIDGFFSIDRWIFLDRFFSIDRCANGYFPERANG